MMNRLPLAIVILASVLTTLNAAGPRLNPAMAAEAADTSRTPEDLHGLRESPAIDAGAVDWSQSSAKAKIRAERRHAAKRMYRPRTSAGQDRRP